MSSQDNDKEPRWKPDAIALWVIDALVIIAILWAVLTQYGCTPNIPSMTNDEIISEVKKCNDAGLLGQVVFDKHRKNVIKVQCITKIKESVEGPVTSSEA